MCSFTPKCLCSVEENANQVMEANQIPMSNVHDDILSKYNDVYTLGKIRMTSLNVRMRSSFFFSPPVIILQCTIVCQLLFLFWLFIGSTHTILRSQLCFTHFAWIWAKACSFAYICMSLAHQTFWLKRHAMSKSVLHLSTLCISFAISYSLPSSVFLCQIQKKAKKKTNNNNNWIALISQQNGNYY